VYLPFPSHTISISISSAELSASNLQFEPGASDPPTSIWHEGGNATLQNKYGLSAALNCMNLLGILIDRLRAMSVSHLMDVRVSLPRIGHQHAQVVKVTSGQFKNLTSSDNDEFSHRSLPVIIP
jgi:hypothetical protein